MKFAGSDNSQSGHFSVYIFQSIAVLLFKLKNDADRVFDVNASIAFAVLKDKIQDWYHQLNVLLCHNTNTKNKL